jgi:hypothetical protein
VLALVTFGLIALAARDNSGTANTTSVEDSGLPSPLVQPLPGTVVLGQWAGRGSTTIDAGSHAVMTGHVLDINAVCAGAGPVTVGPVDLETCVSPVAGEATGYPTVSLKVKAPKGTRWRFALTDQPQTGTNGALARPPDPALESPNAPNVVGFRTGSGPATIPLKAPATAKAPYNLRIALTCAGVGLTLSSSETQLDGKYTHTCFAGWSYEFDATEAKLPATLSVQAPVGTTWRLVVISV